MRDIFGRAFTNVKIRDHENKTILDQSNLFVRDGRAFIRDILAGTAAIDYTKYVVEMGTSAQIPAEADSDIIAPFPNPNEVYTGFTTPSPLGFTEIDFVFVYTNGTGGSVTFRELGLFHRPLGPSPGVARVDKGTLLARLKTTYTSITIGDTKQVTITWKIIF